MSLAGLNRHSRFAWLLMIAVWSVLFVSAQAEGPTDEGRTLTAKEGPLDFYVRAVYAYESYEAYLNQLSQTLGLPVRFAPDVEDLIRGRWVSWRTTFVSRSRLTRYPIPATGYLSAVCDDLKLNWTYRAEKGGILLDAPWRREDARSAKELLEFVMNPGNYEPLGKGPFEKEWRKAQPGQDALHALLSKGDNFSRALAVRQQSIFESFLYLVDPVFGRPRMGAATTGRPVLLPPNIVLRKRVVDVDGHRYFLVLEIRQPFMFPGHGGGRLPWELDAAFHGRDG